MIKSQDGLELQLDGRRTGELVICLRPFSAHACADLALRNVLRVVKEDEAVSDVIGKIGTIGADGVYLWDSGIPQSLVECIPKIDAVVSIIDQVAKVLQRGFLCSRTPFLPLSQVHPYLQLAWNVTAAAYKVHQND